MIWIAVAFLVVILLGGIARVLLAFRDPPEGATARAHFLGRQKMLVLGTVNILGSAVGLFCLANQLLSSLAVLIGVLVLTSLPEIAFRSGTTNTSG